MTINLEVTKKLARKSGLPAHYSIHSLRHTYATLLYKASNYNLRLVQKQLGHASISTTTVYNDIMSEHTEAAVNNLDSEEE